LRADIADLLTPEDKARLMEEANAYAERVAANEGEIPGIAKSRYEYLLDQAYQEAKSKPPLLALKVIWHEIGHAIDWWRHAAETGGVTPFEIKGRGNIFGHIAALHDYLKGVISLDPTKPTGEPIKPADKAKLRKTAEAQLRREMGPIGEIVQTIMVEEPELRITGITPADVKNLFGMDAREQMPELYKWFAEQTAQVKKEIVRKAMRGLLDERLAAMGKTEVVGTRMVERTVRQRVGREPTQAEINERFKALFKEELQRRNLAQLNIVQDELENAIAWWHGSDTMPAYFRTPSEMYAEAFSIFMNNPQALAKRAPTYTRLIWNYMDHRPEVADIYNKLQNEIKTGQAADRTEQAMLDSWDQGNKQALAEAQAQAKFTRGKFRDFLSNVMYHIDRRTGPHYTAAKGAPSEGELRAAIGNFNYRASEHELVLNRINNEVGKKLLQANLDTKDISLYMGYKRVEMERYNLFNPYGVTSQRAIQQLEKLKERIGPKRWDELEGAWGNLRRIWEQRVLAPMRAARMWSPELQDYMEKNLHYATWDVRQTPEGPEDGIQRMLKLRYGNDVSPHIYRQVGTVKEITDPFTATIMKGLSLISATARNEFKRWTVQTHLENDRGNIEEARKIPTQKGWRYDIVNNDKVGTIVFLQDGKPQAYYVRRIVAEGVNGGNHVENAPIRAAIRATGFLKGLFTQLNYGFWPLNFMRDTVGWWVKLPGLFTPFSWLREIPKATAQAYALVKGRPNPAAERALEQRVLISRADPRGAWSAAENAYEVKLASYGLEPAAWANEARNVGAIVKLWNSYKELGQIVERANKIAAFNYMERKFPDMPAWKRNEIVRERGGSPDFLQPGASNPYIDFFAMFYNPWKEEVRSVSRAARENPFSFAAKTTAFVAMPTIAQVLAASGAFGNNKEKQYRSIPDYDLSNYLVVPLGWVGDPAEHKVAYLRLPLWEPARILHMSLWNFMTGRGQGLLSLYGGTLPSTNALLSTFAMWAQYEVMGQNPYDYFRGKNILDENTFKAQGWPATKALLKQSWNNLGGSLAYRFQNQYLDDPPTTGMEEFLQLPIISNALGRWIKVSARGIEDMDRTLTQPELQQRAQTRLAVEEIERKIMAKEGFTDSEKMLLREPYAMMYLTDTLAQHEAAQQSETFRRIKGKSNEEKALILQSIQQGR
jgi:hypothetical protein